MKTAAVAKLKATLSQHLAWVKAGEEVIVTERGTPIAKLVPLPRSVLRSPEILALVRAGLARPGSGRLPRGFWRMPRPKDPAGASLRALLEEREHGR